MESTQVLSKSNKSGLIDTKSCAVCVGLALPWPASKPVVREQKARITAARRGPYALPTLVMFGGKFRETLKTTSIRRGRSSRIRSWNRHSPRAEVQSPKSLHSDGLPSCRDSNSCRLASRIPSGEDSRVKEGRYQNVGIHYLRTTGDPSIRIHKLRSYSFVNLDVGFQNHFSRFAKGAEGGFGSTRAAGRELLRI